MEKAFKNRADYMKELAGYFTRITTIRKYKILLNKINELNNVGNGSND